MNQENMQKLVDIMKALRAPDGCPWDKVQTHKTLKKCSMEECAELMDAIEEDDDPGMCEELGDLLFAAVKVGRFSGIDPEEALHNACEKFLRRFRHVEEAAQQTGQAMSDLPLSRLEEFWADAKTRDTL